MRTLMTMVATTLVLSAPAWAQDGDRRERQSEQMLNRMKERLKLTDEQFAKIKEVVQQNREAEDKLQKEREEKILELLNDEQKKQFEETRRGGRGGGNNEGGQGGRGPMGMGWLGRFMAPPLDELKRDLGLSDEQGEKIKGILEGFGEDLRARIDELRQGGFQGLDWTEEMGKMRERVQGLTDKIKAHLTDDQKAKLDKLFQDRFNRFGGAGGDRTRGEPTRPPRPPVDERVKTALAALKIEDKEDEAAVRAELKKVVEAMYTLEDWDRESKAKLDEFAKGDAAEDAVKARIDEFRAGRKEREKALRDAQRALSEIVSFKQELELIRGGVLR